MSRTRTGEVLVAAVIAAVLVLLPLAGTGGASLLDVAIATTTTTLLPDPLDPVVTTVEDTADEIASNELLSTAPTSTTSTTVPQEDGTRPETTVTDEQPADTSDPDPAQPLVATGPGPRQPVVGGPAATRGSSPVAVAAPITDHLRSPEGSGALSPPHESSGSPAAGEAAVRREIAAQLSVGDAYTRTAGLRSTAALFERISALRLAPNQAARLLAPFPVAGPATYTDDWGLPRHGPGDVARTHKGVDVFADRGTPVIASSDGIVARMATGGLGGVSLRLVAPDGTFYYYAHLDRFAPRLAEGDRVTKGKVLGFVGNSGNAAGTPAHLHYEIHPRGGAAVPPVPFLDRWLAEAEQSVAMLTAAPPSARSSILREALAQRATTDPIGAGAVGSPAGDDLGALQSISSTRGVGFAGLLVVLVVVAWALRRWARLRSRPEVVTEGWTMVDLAQLAAPPVDDETPSAQLAGSRY